MQVSEEVIDKIMDVSNPNFGIFINRKYSHLRSVANNNQQKIINPSGDDKYYANTKFIADLFDLPPSSADRMMKMSDDRNITSSNPTNELDRLKLMSSENYYLGSEMREKIDVEYYDDQGRLQVKRCNGVLLNDVLETYLEYKLEKDIQLNNYDKEELKRFKNYLENNDANGSNKLKFTLDQDGKNLFSTRKPIKITTNKQSIDYLLSRLKHQIESYDLLVDQYEELKNSIAVRKNVNPIDDTVSFERDIAYDEYKKWLQDTDRTEPEEDLFAKRIEQAKSNQANQSKPDQN